MTPSFAPLAARRWRGRRSLALAALATAWLLTRPAGAEPSSPAGDVEEARKHYARGVELYEQHADASALAELERAYKLAPNWKVLYELAVVELAVHDFSAALRYFEQYLDEGKDAVKGARRDEVTREIAQLRRQVATIEVATAEGAEITLDDVTVGTAPLSTPLVVNPGHHKLGASRGGLIAESRAISVAEGDHARFELVVPAPAPPSPAPPSPPAVGAPPPAPVPLPSAPVGPPPAEARAETPSRPAPYPLWIGFAATGALATAALVTGLEALDANSSLTRAKTAAPATTANLGALSSRAQAFALASDIMTGTAILVGGVTLYFTLRPASRSAPVPPTASLALGPGRVSIEGTF